MRVPVMNADVNPAGEPAPPPLAGFTIGLTAARCRLDG